MSDIQDKINKILSDPEALKQVQSLGAQLGLSGEENVSPKPAPPPKAENGEIMNALSGFVPVMSRFSEEDDVSRLLNALRPFLSGEKQLKLDKAQRLMKLVRIIPLIRDSGLFNV